MNPEQISAKDREYYRQTWGFDPITDWIALEGGGYRYESKFPLEHDASLLKEGVTIGARVDVRKDGAPQNFMVLAKNDQERTLNCVHTVIYRGSVEQVLSKNEMDFVGTNNVETVSLPPWEHFVALKSFVGAIAEMGIANIFEQGREVKIEDQNPLPFGFNDFMEEFIVSSLWSLAPSATKAIIRDWLIRLVEHAPGDWIIVHRAQLLPKFEDLYVKEGEPSPEEVLLREIAEEIQSYCASDWLETHKIGLQGFFRDLFMSPRDRELVRKRWGFDPITDRSTPRRGDSWFRGPSKDEMYISETRYYYHFRIDPKCDPLLDETGVKLCGRVDVDYEGNCRDMYLGFERQGAMEVIDLYFDKKHPLLEENINNINREFGYSLQPPAWVYAAALMDQLQQIAERGLRFLFPLLQVDVDPLGKVSEGSPTTQAPPIQNYREQVDLFEILSMMAPQQTEHLIFQYLVGVIEGRVPKIGDSPGGGWGFNELIFGSNDILPKFLAFVSPEWARKHMTALRELFVWQPPDLLNEENLRNRSLLDKIEGITRSPRKIYFDDEIYQFSWMRGLKGLRFDGFYISRKVTTETTNGHTDSYIFAYRFFPSRKVVRVIFPELVPAPFHLLVNALIRKFQTTGEYTTNDYSKTDRSIEVYFHHKIRKKGSYNSLLSGRITDEGIQFSLPEEIFRERWHMRDDEEEEDGWDRELDGWDWDDDGEEWEEEDELFERPVEVFHRFYPFPLSNLQQFLSKLSSTHEISVSQILEIFDSPPDDVFWELIFRWVEKLGLEPRWKESYLKLKAELASQKNSQIRAASIAKKLNLSSTNEELLFTDSQSRKLIKYLNKHLNAWQCAGKISQGS